MRRAALYACAMLPQDIQGRLAAKHNADLREQPQGCVMQLLYLLGPQDLPAVGYFGPYS